MSSSGQRPLLPPAGAWQEERSAAAATAATAKVGAAKTAAALRATTTTMTASARSKRQHGVSRSHPQKMFPAQKESATFPCWIWTPKEADICLRFSGAGALQRERWTTLHGPLKSQSHKRSALHHRGGQRQIQATMARLLHPPTMRRVFRELLPRKAVRTQVTHVLVACQRPARAGLWLQRLTRPRCPGTHPNQLRRIQASRKSRKSALKQGKRRSGGSANFTKHVLENLVGPRIVSWWQMSWAVGLFQPSSAVRTSRRVRNTL
mmetsp:Transcript_27266/g.53294  ORF Transcript_27266/g.53294 Transcript_27266/m.53294 type:complete len:264 (-) Transcript_27266:307-1098(-)